MVIIGHDDRRSGRGGWCCRSCRHDTMPRFDLLFAALARLSGQRDGMFLDKTRRLVASSDV